MHAYYGGELVFYASSIFMLAFWEERRKDFPVMMLHHIASVILIILSHLGRYAVWPGEARATLQLIVIALAITFGCNRVHHV